MLPIAIVGILIGVDNVIAFAVSATERIAFAAAQRESQIVVDTTCGVVLGAETSYIVVGNEHLGDEYYCLLTREDGTLVSTCPITYAGGKTPIENVTDRQVYPTLVSAGENLHIVGETAVTIVDVLGNHVAAYRSKDAHWTIPAPARSGLYFILNTQQIIARIIVH